MQLSPIAHACRSALALLLAAPLAAQDLAVEVQTDPQAGLATYTVRLDGPPGGGTALLFASLLPGLADPPFALPGLLGEVYLNPLLAVSVGNITLDPFGQGQWNVQLPYLSSSDQPLYFQSVVIDSQFTLAMSNLALGYHQDLQGPDGPLARLRLSNESVDAIGGEVHGAPGTELKIEHYDPSLSVLKGSQTFSIGVQGSVLFGFGVSPRVEFCDTTFVYVRVDGAWVLHKKLTWHQE